MSKMNFFDSVIAQCIVNILAEEIKDILPSSNFGNRLNKPHSDNMYQYWKSGYSKFVNAEIEATENKRYSYVIEADIENFYPSIDKDMLIKDIKTVLSINVQKESLFLEWLNKILDIKAINEYGEVISITGLPQGTLYSPLLSMFYTRDYLDDIKLNFPNVQAFGYVDDIRIYCETEKEAQEIRGEFTAYIEKKNLQLNKDKSNIFLIDNKKRFETKIMGKASNLDRAIRDEIIVSSHDKAEMRERLRLLIKELRELQGDDNKDKLEERLQKFVDYRIVKLLDDNVEQWDKYLKEFVNPNALEGNFIAMWHALFLSCSSLNQKRNFIKVLGDLLKEEQLEELNYVKYMIYSYLFRWSPRELRYSNEEANNIVKKHFNNQYNLYIKAALINIHNDWKDYINTEKDLIINNNSDEEVTNLFYSLGLSPILDETYKKNTTENRLYYKEDKLVHTNNTFNLVNGYLQSERVKNVEYELFNNIKGNWSIKDETRGQLLTDLKLSEENKKYLLNTLCRWLDFQFQSYEGRIPCSVIHPDYIYFDSTEKNIYIKGNPAFNNDIFYYDSPNNIWQTTFASLIELLFNIDLGKGVNIFTDSQNLTIYAWQYRIINKLFHGYFNVKEFVKYVLNVMNSDNSYSMISYEQYKLNNLLRHYIKDFNYLDNLLLISIFVESSWKNGSKECNFFTLHNHEHGRYLIYHLHNIFDKADYSIYINSKEAFRLFSACFLHDLGMLSAPTKKRLFDESEEDINNLTQKVDRILRIAKSKNLEEELVLSLSHIYDIYNEVEKLRDNIVRSEHPYVSEQEIVNDYPGLPLTVAERRDIGIISAAHGQYKSEVNNINNTIYDGLHPIRLKLLSLLLRLADLSDVSKDRVRREVLERNFQRMDNISVYHWIKHLSVENLHLETIRSEELNTPTKVIIYLNHNYLPSGNLEKERLKIRCGKRCKIKLEDDGFKGKGQKGFFAEGQKYIEESNTDFKYFEKNTCNLTCAFVNESYNWFFAEIIYLNKYLNENNINLKFDLSIRKTNNNTKDFHYINNRNKTYSAQEFMIKYFQ
ncbi:HD domain-containing protein [Priestia aryabhattai]|uniref:HD domain-containing protein n=1 Tax=Priestia aryabhattai TaxID=412384 RepID=UPI0020D28A40|nr:reverse transcriptase domain-containing protein [Priestia aryabhattai]